MKVQLLPANVGGERACCTVRATATALGLEWDQAHAKLASLGRKTNRGVKWSKVASQLGFEIRPDLCCRTLESILPEMQEGRFVVRHARHVFAVVDGTIYDWHAPTPKLRVKMVYQFPNAATL